MTMTRKTREMVEGKAVELMEKRSQGCLLPRGEGENLMTPHRQSRRSIYQSNDIYQTLSVASIYTAMNPSHELST